MIPEKYYFISGAILVVWILFAGKIKCWIMQKHQWSSSVLWRSCKSCGKTQYLNMKIGKYID